MDDQKPVWTSLSRNRRKLPCTETGIVQPQNSYIGHQGGKWKIKGTPIFLKKNSLLMLSLVETLEKVEVGGKIAEF